ncbi:MAG: hypothetical protein WCJ45_04165 [bacterium]
MHNKYIIHQFELFLKALASGQNMVVAAQQLCISVKVKNLVDPRDLLYEFSDLVYTTWLALIAVKKRCELDPLPSVPEVLVVIKSAEGNLIIEIESPYLEKMKQLPAIEEDFGHFIQEANSIIDELLGMEEPLTIDGILDTKNFTVKVHTIIDFFDRKINKVLSAVLINKFFGKLNTKR